MTLSIDSTSIKAHRSAVDMFVAAMRDEKMDMRFRLEIKDFLDRSQIAGVLFDHVAVRIEHVVGGRGFRDQVLDQAVQLGTFRTVTIFD